MTPPGSSILEAEAGVDVEDQRRRHLAESGEKIRFEGDPALTRVSLGDEAEPGQAIPPINKVGHRVPARSDLVEEPFQVGGEIVPMVGQGTPQ
jgi:hypothetical protein